MEELTFGLAQIWQNIDSFFAIDRDRLTDPDIVVRLVIQAILFLLSAFFSGSETALFSLSRLDLQKLRRERHAQTDNLHALLDQPRRLIISILCADGPRQGGLDQYFGHVPLAAVARRSNP